MFHFLTAPTLWYTNQGFLQDWTAICILKNSGIKTNGILPQLSQVFFKLNNRLWIYRIGLRAAFVLIGAFL